MNDVKGYIEKLNKSMTRKEKLFFLNKVKWEQYDAVVDFGGADGRLLYEVDKYLTKHKKDREKKILLFNVECNLDIEPRYYCYRPINYVFSLDTLIRYLIGNRVLLILSSVLHEVDSGTREAIVDFAVNYADTVVIRDMHFTASRRTMNRERNKARLFFEKKDIFLNTDEQRRFLDVCRYSPYGWAPKALYEFFLKYTYVANWATEKQENYFSDNVFNTDQDLLKCGFQCKYCKHYTLSYKKKEVFEHFSYKMRAKTHIKLILKREKKKELSVGEIKRKLKR